MNPFRRSGNPRITAIEISSAHACLLAFVGSLFLSAIAISTDHVFNPDGGRYLRGAYSFLYGDNPNYTYSEWPFYDVLIGGLSHLSGLAVVQSAYFWNALFQAASCAAFVRLYERIQPTGNVNHWPAIITILLLAGFNNSRDEIIRDHGYILFSIIAIIFLIDFLENSRKRALLACIFSMALAFLFRVEGLALFAAAPVLALMHSGLNRDGMQKSIWLALPSIAGILLLIFAFASGALPFRRIDFLWHQISQIITGVEYRNAATLLKNSVMWPDSGLSNAYWFLSGGVVALIIHKVISCMSAFCFVSFASGFFIGNGARASFNPQKRVILGVILLCIGYLSIYVGLYRFCATRYVFLLTIMLSLFAAGTLQYIFTEEQFFKHRKWLALGFTLLAIVSVQHSKILRSDGKAYVIDAAAHVTSSTENLQTVYTNHYYIRYATQYQANTFKINDTNDPTMPHFKPGDPSTEGLVIAAYVRGERDEAWLRKIEEKGFYLDKQFKNRKRRIDVYRLSGE